MAIKFKNNATGTLKNGINDTVTAIELTTGHGDRFPAVTTPNYFYATFEDVSGNREIVKVTARSAGQDTMTIVRAQDDTSARSWLALDVFEQRQTAGVYEDIFEDIITNAADIATNLATIGGHTTTLGTHTSGIAQNVSDIADNVVDITANYDAIAVLQSVITAPSGLKMYFYEDTAPTGWTIDSGVADVLLGVKGGSNAYNVSGGAKAGTWTVPTHVHTTPGHALTIAEMPVHHHYMIGSGGSGVNGFGGADTLGSTDTSDTGSGNSHAHGDTGAGATAATYRPYAAVGIIATKD